MTTSRTLHRDCCPKCQGSGRVVDEMVPPLSWTECDHTVRTDVTGPTDDEIRIARLEDRNRELETKLAECAATCEAEARKARDAALVEAAAEVREVRSRLAHTAVADVIEQRILALRGRG